MKWQSKRQKQKELRVLGFEALAPLSQRFDNTAASDLELSLYGTLVVPTDADYHRDRQLANFAFQGFPELIAHCELISDVKQCLRFARAKKLEAVVRTGGHSTAGFSINNGMVIDLRRMSYVVVDAVRKQAVVGPGTSFGRLNAALDTYNLHVPGGGCHDVCVAGFMQGGGYGYTSRQFGMNCDNVVELLVMLADGSLVVASDTTNPDLFWALRGGTGGNFGIVLQITYQLYSLPQLFGFRFWWSLERPEQVKRAAEVLTLLQSNYTRRAGPKELGYMAFLGWQNEERCLLVRGVYAGSEAEARYYLAPLLAFTPERSDYGVGSYKEMDKFLHQKPEVPQVDDLAREDKQSGYIDRPLGANGWHEVIKLFLGTPNPWSLLAIEPYGGAISAKSADENAFVHRKVDMNLYVDVFWMNEAERVSAVQFLDDFMQHMEAHYFNGQSYQNYPRGSQTDYRHRYWGDSFYSLRAVKLKYDPGDFFAYAQGVLPDSEYPDPPSTDKLLPKLQAWLAAPIEYQIR